MNFNSDKTSVWKILMSLWYLCIALSFSESAFASAVNQNDVIGTSLCRVLNVLNGPTIKVIATIGVLALGFGLFMGKLSWPVALIVLIGIGVVFGASKLVSLISGSDITQACQGIS